MTATVTERNSFLPFILNPKDSIGAPAIEGFRKNLAIVKNDILHSCLRDLIVTRNPQKKLSDSEIEKLVTEHLAGVLPDDYGVWVFYPWNQTLVHLPSKDEFVELRTNRNKYKISPEEEKSLAKKKIGIVGLSVGNAVTMAITLERGCGELRIADMDTIELSNLNRIQAGVQTIGMSKAVLAARQIAEIDPFIKVSCFTEGVTEKNIDEFFSKDGKNLDLLIDECDSLDIKVLLREKARELGIPVLMATSDRGMIDIERFDLEPDRLIFHGLIEGVDTTSLRNLTTEEKIPHVSKILAMEEMSSRCKASLLEVGSSITTWPQLASGVMLGGAQVADTARRILLGEEIPSGRYLVDFETLISVSSPTRKFSTLCGKEDVVAIPVAQSPIQFPPKQSICSMERQIDNGRAFLRSFPESSRALLLNEGTVRAFVADAIMAPSGGNVQPWIWLYERKVLLLMLDKERSESTLDFNRTASIAALGAAAENVVLSAHRHGYEVIMNLYAGPSDRMLYVIFEFLDKTSPYKESHEHDELFFSIGTRKTNRRVGARRILPDEWMNTIRRSTESVHGAALSVISSETELEKLGKMLGASDRMRMLNRRLHEEMMREMRFTEEEALATRDGISVADLDLGVLDRTGLSLCRDWNTLSLMKRFGGAMALEKMSQKAIRAASAAALLTMPVTAKYPLNTSFFFGGRAMQRAWLTATSLGVAFQPMSALPYLFARHKAGDDGVLSSEEKHELAAMRPEFEKLFQINPNERCSEVLLFRLAVTDTPTYKSLRRSVDEVLFF